MNKAILLLSLIMVMGLSCVASAQTEFTSGYMYLSPPGGVITLWWTIPTECGTCAVGPSTRTVYEGFPGNTQITVNDVKGTCNPVSSTNSGALSITWQVVVTIPVTAGVMPTGDVSYEFDESQQPSTEAWNQISSSYSVSAYADQYIESASSEEDYFSYAPDIDDPDAATATVENTVSFGTMSNVSGVWTSGYITVLSTSDTVSVYFDPNGVEGLSAGATTVTTMNFNQSGAGGMGGNSLTITGGD